MVTTPIQTTVNAYMTCLIGAQIWLAKKKASHQSSAISLIAYQIIGLVRANESFVKKLEGQFLPMFGRAAQTLS
jgi:hypothetical protein